MQQSHVDIRRPPVAYSALRDALANRLVFMNFARVYRELCGGNLQLTPAGISTAVGQVVKALDDQEYFPVYTDYAEEYAELRELAETEPGELALPDLSDFLQVDGLSGGWAIDFDDWNDLWRLVLAISSDEHSPERHQNWWADLSKRLGLALPSPAEIDRNVAVARLEQNAIPGLRAMYYWLVGNTGNVFVDVSPEDSGELRWEYDWSMETITALAAEYEEALETIFDPANTLFNRCQANETAVLRQVAIYLLTGELTDEHS